MYLHGEIAYAGLVPLWFQPSAGTTPLKTKRVPRKPHHTVLCLTSFQNVPIGTELNQLPFLPEAEEAELPRFFWVVCVCVFPAVS